MSDYNQILKLASNSGPSAGTTPVVTGIGGKFMLQAISGGWGGGNAQLQEMGPDGSTWLNVGTAMTANGVQVLDLPPGSYRAVITTATGVWFWLVQID